MLNHPEDWRLVDQFMNNKMGREKEYQGKDAKEDNIQ